jgi:hypothetical protein
MSENVTIVLIIVVGIVVVFGVALFIFKDRLDKFKFSASKKKLSASMEKNQGSVTVSGNVQTGVEHEIDVRGDNLNIKNNQQQGQSNKIRVNN